jgi:Spy/CpxP family protein refolding chaperone
LPLKFTTLWIAVGLVAGLLIGFAASTLGYRYHWMHVPHRGIVRQMDRELKLTPAQHDQVMQVMEDTRFKIEQMRHEFLRRRRELLDQAHAQIRAFLTPEQQAKFDRTFAFKGPAGPPGPH